MQTLQGCIGTSVVELDFTDDRLASILDKLGDDSAWQALETDLNSHLLRVYDLQPERVRLDSTTVSGYWDVTPEGLFQFGPSKDHRPDLPQLKVMLSALDPLGLPLVTQVVSGQRADDPLYIPAIEQVRRGVRQHGLLYIGDVKMSARETRAYLVAGGDYYLSPLSQRQVPQDVMDDYLTPVWKREQLIESVYRMGTDGTQTLLAEGFEKFVDMAADLEGQTIQWAERRLVIRSVAQTEAQQIALGQRLAKAETALATYNVHKQGKKRYTEIVPVQQKVEALLARHRVSGLLTVQYVLGEVRTPKGVPKPMVKVVVERNEDAIQQAKDRMGWRVYVTNHTAQQLSVTDAVLAYRTQYLVERNFSRLKGRPLTIRPMYLADDQRATGLVRLLSLGLRVLTALEFVVRQRLAEEATLLAGLYKGNPKRTTVRPTAERLLEAFENITLSIITLDIQVHYHLTPLSDLQLRILTLLDFPHSPYLSLGASLSTPP
ncbi:MAG: IS1634 family transposase [Anaerolineae bacterium]|nr:IS1634 family transposase [Anaerolineae bacterium]